MADNVGYTPGSGATVAAREVTYSGDTAKVQVVGLGTFSGNDDAKVIADVSPDAPLPVAAYGELLEAVEALRMAVHSLTRSMGQVLPDAFGRQRVLVDSFAGGATLGGVTTVSTLTNQTNIGAFAASEHIPSLMRMTTDGLRSNIVVT